MYERAPCPVFLTSTARKLRLRLFGRVTCLQNDASADVHTGFYRQALRPELELTMINNK